MGKGKKSYRGRQPAPLLAWVGKALFLIVGFILTIVGINWLLSRAREGVQNTKHDLFSGVNSLITGSVAGVTLSAQRKNELQQIADAIYVSMDGPGTYYYDFIEAMTQINTDAEYEYVYNHAFGKKEEASLSEWINSEWQITDSVKREVNSNYASKGMTKRI